MSTQEIIRAWKDAAYRESLSEVEQAQLPENPAGLIQLTDEELESVAGGYSIYPWQGCFTRISWCIWCPK